MEEFLGICISKEPLRPETPNNGVLSLPKRNRSPKLKQFDYGYAKFDQLEFYASGKEGYIFKFRYDNEDLCFRLFKEWRSQAIPWLNKDQRKTCAFANECRAFARLNDYGYNGVWAVKCHGWIQLTDSQLASCAKLVDLEDCSRLAIVKDFIPEPVLAEHVPDICKKFEITKEVGIVPGDVCVRNYRRSFIVDLGSTMTSPLYSNFEFNLFYNRYDKVIANWSLSY